MPENVSGVIMNFLAYFVIVLCFALMNGYLWDNRIEVIGELRVNESTNVLLRCIYRESTGE